MPVLYAQGKVLDAGADCLGYLRESSDVLGDVVALRQRMGADGYLFFRGLLGREAVLDVRREVASRLRQKGCLDPSAGPMETRAAGNYDKKFMPDLARENLALDRVLYGGPMMDFFGRFLGGDVRHFDYTWFRAVAPGKGTACHCDSVYMGRGTPQLYTAWTPIGDVDFRTGGLIVLEGSNNHERLRETYCRQDVDSFCANRAGRAGLDAWAKGTAGVLGKDARLVRRALGGRWLTAEYRAGDVLIFSIFTVHASLDNRSDCIRLSSDSRYQLASEVADERWVGAKPLGHSQAGKRGRIC